VDPEDLVISPGLLEYITRQTETINRILGPAFAVSQRLAEQMAPFLEASQRAAEQMAPFLEASQRAAEQMAPIFEASQRAAEQMAPIFEAVGSLNETTARYAAFDPPSAVQITAMANDQPGFEHWIDDVANQSAEDIKLAAEQAAEALKSPAFTENLRKLSSGITKASLKSVTRAGTFALAAGTLYYFVMLPVTHGLDTQQMAVDQNFLSALAILIALAAFLYSQGGKSD
jgi:hypothetical protein